MNILVIKFMLLPFYAAGGSSPYQPHPPGPSGIGDLNPLSLGSLIIYLIGFLIILIGLKLKNNVTNECN